MRRIQSNLKNQNIYLCLSRYKMGKRVSLDDLTPIIFIFLFRGCEGISIGDSSSTNDSEIKKNIRQSNEYMWNWSIFKENYE